MLQGYRSHLRDEKRLSPLTCENYLRDAGALFRLAGEIPVAEIDPRQVRRFIASLHAGGLGGRSLARMLSAWRSFFNYLIREHGCQANPVNGIRAPKSPKTLPEALSPDDAGRLLSIQGGDDLAVRDRAMFELFYSSGLRLSELAKLELGDIDFSEALVRVTGKGNKTRMVPVGRMAIDALGKWLEKRRELAAEQEKILFLGKKGNPLSQRAIQYRLEQWGVKQGIPQHVHPHMLRHSFASHVLQSSGDLRAVQEMLGHASISTTQVYTHLDFQHLSKIYDAAHPRAKKKDES
ncbi:MAG: tyrosine recombinase XerC [Burkholderiales bacterium]|nr:tyrosine recombinase XerC [Burkholderiales bacterium]